MEKEKNMEKNIDSENRLMVEHWKRYIKITKSVFTGDFNYVLSVIIKTFDDMDKEFKNKIFDLMDEIDKTLVTREYGIIIIALSFSLLKMLAETNFDITLED